MQSAAISASGHLTPDSPVHENHNKNFNEVLYGLPYDLSSVPILGVHGSFNDLGSNTSSHDPYQWLTLMDLDQDFNVLQCSGKSEEASQQATEEPTASSCVKFPTPASEIVNIYIRSQTPTIDRDAVEVRQYHATSIEVDAPLHFPDADLSSLLGTRSEDFAHVDQLSDEKVNDMTQLAEDAQRESHHHPFTNVKLPPRPILNAWVQLYFEHFHPVFPIIHKPTFMLPEVDPLLVLAVAGIGAQFSRLKNAETFARCIHELVRRRSSSMVSTCHIQVSFAK